MSQLDGYVKLGALAYGCSGVAWYWNQGRSMLMTWIDSIGYVIYDSGLDSSITNNGLSYGFILIFHILL